MSKDPRFMTTPGYISVPGHPPGYLVVIFDYTWYAQHGDEVDLWIADNLTNAVRTGMVIHVKNEADAGIFMLRWAGC